MEAQLKAQAAGGSAGEAPAARPRSTAARAKPPAPATAVTAAAEEDPFARSLTGILSSGGGVAQERHVPLLLQLVKRARSKPHRIALLTVLQLSGGEVLRAAVADGLLLELQTWLSEFVAEGKQAMVQKALACLDKLPVTLASLQPPCELGKLVGRLRKHEGFGSAVIEPAKRLVARWKAMVDAAVKSGAGGSSSRSARANATLPVLLQSAASAWHLGNSKRRSAAAARHAPAGCLQRRCPRLFFASCNAMPPTPQQQAFCPACDPGAACISSTITLMAASHSQRCGMPNLISCHAPSAARPAMCSTTPTAAAAKPAAAPAAKVVAAPAPVTAAATSTAAQLDRQSSGGAAAAAMEDGDIFKSADRQRAGIKDAVPAVKKVRRQWYLALCPKAQLDRPSNALPWCLCAACQAGCVLVCLRGFSVQ